MIAFCVQLEADFQKAEAAAAQPDNNAEVTAELRRTSMAAAPALYAPTGRASMFKPPVKQQPHGTQPRTAKEAMRDAICRWAL